MSKDRDVIDALLVSAFFLGYAVVLVMSKRVPRPPKLSAPLDSKRLAFFRGMRDALIDAENTVTVHDGD